MRHNPWEADSQLVKKYLTLYGTRHSFSCSKGPATDSLSQMIPVHNLQHCLLEIHSNITLPFTTTSSKWLHPSYFSPKIFYAFLISHACYMLHPSHNPWFNHPNKISWRVQIIKFLMQFCSASCYFLFLRPRKQWRFLMDTVIYLRSP
jgi:hypothetical protein